MSYLRSSVSIKDVIKSLGIVFGDIGTSPIYTMTVVFAFIPVTENNILGVLSLILWTLIILVSLQYAWLAMSISKKGEGGTVVLKEILTPLLKSKKQTAIVTLLSFIGISFFIGDGVITPAISIMSAVEGLGYISFLPGINQNILIIIACILSIILFNIQKRGTETVSLAFGPIMLIWFILLGLFGFFEILKNPGVIKAINPLYAIIFLKTHGFIGFILLSKVMLCATGGEALYADMGQLGRKPIISAWFFTFISLFLVYLGQGAFLINNPNAKQIFHEMVSNIFKNIGLENLYAVFVLFSVIATIIASQAMISGIFSIVYQGIITHIIPTLHVEYTSKKLMSQIYIPTINWFLMVFVLFAILEFKYSRNLAGAYGLAASVTMTITATMLACIFWLQKNYFKFSAIFLIVCIDLVFYLLICSKFLMARIGLF